MNMKPDVFAGYGASEKDSLLGRVMCSLILTLIFRVVELGRDSLGRYKLTRQKALSPNLEIYRSIPCFLVGHEIRWNPMPWSKDDEDSTNIGHRA